MRAAKDAPWRIYVGLSRGIHILIVPDVFFGCKAKGKGGGKRNAVGSSFEADEESVNNAATRLAGFMVALANEGKLYVALPGMHADAVAKTYDAPPMPARSITIALLTESPPATGS